MELAFVVGQKVRIIDGPFEGSVGNVDDINEARRKLKLLVSFYGRQTPVEVHFLQVERL